MKIALALLAVVCAGTARAQDVEDVIGKFRAQAGAAAQAHPQAPLGQAREDAPPEIARGCRVPPSPPGVTIEGNLREVTRQFQVTNGNFNVPEEREKIERTMDPKAKTDARMQLLIGSLLALGARGVWFFNKVKPGGDWDYKSLCRDCGKYDNFGNFNYGATGAALGIPETVLHVGAGAVQRPMPREEEAKAIGWPFKDDHVGFSYIRAGYRYYNYCPHR